MRARRNFDQQRFDEETPLLLIPEEERGSLKRYAADALVGLDRCLAVNNMLCFPSGIIDPSLAYPSVATLIYKPTYMLSLVLCLTELGLDIAVARRFTLHLFSLEIDAKKLKYFSDTCKTVMNTFNFTLITIVAAYLALDEVFNHIGDDRVETSDRRYDFGFLLPSFSFSVALAILELSKKYWKKSTKFLDWTSNCLHNFNRLITTAGSFNTIALPLFSLLRLSETGNVNPYTRMGLFSFSIGLGGLSLICSKRYPQHAEKIERTQDTASTTAYLTRLFDTTSRTLLEKSGTVFMAIALFMLNLIAFMSAFAFRSESSQQHTSSLNAASINGDSSFNINYAVSNANIVSARSSVHSASSDPEDQWYFTAPDNAAMSTNTNITASIASPRASSSNNFSLFSQRHSFDHSTVQSHANDLVKARSLPCLNSSC